MPRAESTARHSFLSCGRAVANSASSGFRQSVGTERASHTKGEDPGHQLFCCLFLATTVISSMRGVWDASVETI